MTTLVEHGAVYRLEERTVTIQGVEQRLRLVEFASGWLASVDTVSGPTLGADRSPYLAAWRALDPLGIELSEVMLLIGGPLGSEGRATTPSQA